MHVKIQNSMHSACSRSNSMHDTYVHKWNLHGMICTKVSACYHLNYECNIIIIGPSYRVPCHFPIK